MSRTLSPRTQAINATKARVGEIMSGYARAKDPTQAVAARAQVLEAMHEVLVTPIDAAAQYRRHCENFLDDVIAVRGIPFKEIGADDDTPTRSSSGEWVADHFDEFLPEIQRQLDTCVSRYLSHAQAIFQRYQDEFVSLLDDFLSDAPRLVKDIGPRVTPIKREAGYYARWDRLAGVLTNGCFLVEVEFIFHHGDDRYIAVEWEYSNLDEQTDFAPATGHQKRDKAIYTVKGNWALQKGIMIPSSAGYIEDTDIPGRQLGCMCHLVWITSPADLPEDMLTDIGREAVRVSQERFRQRLAETEKVQKGFWLTRALTKLLGRKS